MSVLMSLRPPFKRGGIWYFEIDRQRKSLKTADKAVALRRFKEFKRQYLAGKITQISGECGITLGAFADEYLAWSEENRPKPTYRADRLALAKIQAASGKSVRLDRIGLKDLDAMVTACRQAKNKPASINIHIRHLRSAFNKAVEWSYLKSNPFRGAREVPKEKRPPSYLSKVDVAKFLASIKDVDLRRLVAAYLATGRRRAELLDLRWEDVRMDEGRYYIRRAKRSLERWYPMSDAFRSILASVGQAQGRVFARWSHPDTISHAVKDALKTGGWGHLRLHDLRHSFAVLFLEVGGDMRTLQDLLGHTEFRTTEIYAHLTGDHLKMAVNMVKLGPVDLFGKK